MGNKYDLPVIFNVLLKILSWCGVFAFSYVHRHSVCNILTSCFGRTRIAYHLSIFSLPALLSKSVTVCLSLFPPQSIQVPPLPSYFWVVLSDFSLSPSLLLMSDPKHSPLGPAGLHRANAPLMSLIWPSLGELCRVRPHILGGWAISCHRKPPFIGLPSEFLLRSIVNSYWNLIARANHFNHVRQAGPAGPNNGKHRFYSFSRRFGLQL